MLYTLNFKRYFCRVLWALMLFKSFIVHVYLLVSHSGWGVHLRKVNHVKQIIATFCRNLQKPLRRYSIAGAA